MDFISIHPMYTHANIMNKKKLNITANISTAQVAINRINMFRIVNIISSSPLVGSSVKQFHTVRQSNLKKR